MIKQFEQHTRQQIEQLLEYYIPKKRLLNGAFTIQQIMYFVGKYFREYQCKERIKEKIRKFTVNDDRAVPRDYALEILWEGELRSRVLHKRRVELLKMKQSRRLKKNIIKKQEKKEDTMQDVEQIQSQKEEDQLSISMELEQTKDVIIQAPSNLPPVLPPPPPPTNLLSQQTQEIINTIQRIYVPRDLQTYGYEFNRVFGMNAEIQLQEFKRKFLFLMYPGYELGLINYLYFHITQAFKKINLSSGYEIISKIEQYKLEYFKFQAELIYFTEKLFMIYDKNRNEQIELCELEEFYKDNSNHLRHLRVFNARRIMNSFDINRSGTLEKGQVLLSLIQLRRRGFTLNKLCKYKFLLTDSPQLLIYQMKKRLMNKISY